jgi:hypothetical protein
VGKVGAKRCRPVLLDRRQTSSLPAPTSGARTHILSAAHKERVAAEIVSPSIRRVLRRHYLPDADKPVLQPVSDAVDETLPMKSMYWM